MRFKILNISLIIMFIILITSTVIAATGTVGLRLSSDKVKKGEIFTVTLFASSDDGINGIDTIYSFDSNKLELISEELVDSTKWTNLGIAPEITAICNTTEKIKSADIYILKFKVKETATVGDVLKIETEGILLDTDLPTNSEVSISSQKVEIEVEKQLSKIEVTTKPKKINYIQNYENLDLTDGLLTATYDNNSTETISLNDNRVKVTGFDNSKVGKNTITVEFGGKTATFDVTIEAKKLAKIEVTQQPTKTEYIEGENFNSSGMKVVATYNDNTSKEISNYVIIDGNNMPKEKTSVTISYTEGNITKTVVQGIKVLEKLKIEFMNYNELYEAGKTYLKSINPETTLEEFITKVSTNGNIQILKNNIEVTNNATKISTGMKLKISLNNESYECIIVVKGDTNGDGDSDLKDLLQVNKHRLNKTLLKDEYLLAGDVNQDNVVNLKDLLQINKFRLGKISSL